MNINLLIEKLSLLNDGNISGRVELNNSVNEIATLNIENRGVSIGFLKKFTATFDCFSWQTHKVVSEIIKPLTDNDQCRFVDMEIVRPFSGKCQMFISHAWNGIWGDLVAAVSHYSRDDRIVWIDIFAVLQHPQAGQGSDLAQLQNVIRQSNQGTLLVWNPSLENEKANPILRAWCLFELSTTVQNESPLIIKLGKGNKLDFEMIEEVEKVTKLTYAADISEAKATVPDDLTRIMKVVEEQGGVNKLNARVRTAIYNSWRVMQMEAVHHAAYGNKEALEKIVKSGKMEKEWSGDPGGSLLSELVHGNMLDGIKIVLEMGFDIDAVTAKGNSALIFACEAGYLKIVDYLVSNGAKVNLQNGKGETALMKAANFGHPKIVQLLLDAGAETELQNNGGYTALMLAKRNTLPKCREVVVLLGGEPHNYNWVCCLYQ